MENFKPDGFTKIPTNKEEVFLEWLKLTKMFHGLNNPEMRLIAKFLKYKDIYSRTISDPELLEKNFMSEDTKRIIREELGITTSNFQVLMYSLRKKGAIKDGKIVRKLMPNIDTTKGTYSFLILFEIKDA